MSLFRGLEFGCGTVVLVPFMLVGCVMVAFAWNSYQEYRHLLANGVVVQGRMLDHRFSTSDDSTSYYLTYEFVASDDQWYRNEQAVDREQYDRFEKGGSVDIEYDHRDPTRSKIAGTNTVWQAVGLLGFGVCWNSIIGVLFAAHFPKSFWRRVLPARAFGRLLKL